MTYSNRALYRRPRTEQAVLAMLRGERNSLRGADQNCAFGRLRYLARQSGLVIYDADTGYLGDDELTVLSWLAISQRPRTKALQPADPALASAINDCASRLIEAGMRLYPITIYQYHLFSRLT
ncbi:hypothetical protein [Novosphingobium barchaimii]|uniref:hypothetical protein n=1 Tax=Novosphingobium barchaimii TaxID=1420591 RepID=UPI000AB5AE52|nr:hypothetical protein [Novosphingobium barchaimii]